MKNLFFALLFLSAIVGSVQAASSVHGFRNSFLSVNNYGVTFNDTPYNLTASVWAGGTLVNPSKFSGNIAYSPTTGYSYNLSINVTAADRSFLIGKNVSFVFNSTNPLYQVAPYVFESNSNANLSQDIWNQSDIVTSLAAYGLVPSETYYTSTNGTTTWYNYALSFTNWTSNSPLGIYQIDPTVFPSGILYAINFTVYNTQSLVTGTNFTQLIQINGSAYNTYLNSTLSNVEFFNDSGSILPSWLEVGNSTYNNITWWVDIPYGIGANSNVTIYAGFANLSTNFFNASGLTGEEPTLSKLNGNGAYAAYDNGAQVFRMYFNGNTPVGNFGANTPSQVTGITMPDGSLGNAIQSTAPWYYSSSWPIAPTIIETSAQQYNSGQQGNTAMISSSASVSATYEGALASNGGHYYTAHTNSGTGGAAGSSYHSWTYSEVDFYGTQNANFFSMIAPQLYSTSGGFSANFTQTITSGSNLYFSTAVGNQYTDVNWERARSYPPNGDMPIVYNNGIVLNPSGTINVTIYSPPAGTLYNESPVNFNYSFFAGAFVSATCTAYQNGAVVQSSVIANSTPTSITSNTLIPQSNNFTVTCVNGTTLGTLSVFPYVFEGVNITVFNAANLTAINNWNITASNNTFTNYTQIQNSSYLWEWPNIPIGNNVLFNATTPQYANGNVTVNTSSSLLVPVNIYQWPLETFFVQNSTGGLVSTFTISFNNGTQTTSCTTSNYSCAQSLQFIGYGTNNLTVIAPGFQTLNVLVNFTTNSQVNQTFTVGSAVLTLNAFDQVTNQPLTFNVTITNATTSQTFSGLTDPTIYNAGQVPTGALTIVFNNQSGGYRPATYFVVFTNNTQVSITAYLLQNSIAAQVGFKVTTSLGTPIQGALVSVGAQNGTGYPVIGQQLTGTDGVASFFLNPATQYQVNASFNGVASNNNLITPVSNLYTITLNTQSNVSLNNFYNLTVFALTPSRQLYLQNETIQWYVFSQYGYIQYFALNLSWNGTSIFFQNQSSSVYGGNITDIVNVSNQTPYNFSAYPYILATGFIQIPGYPLFNYTYLYPIGVYQPTGAYNVLTAFQGISTQFCPNGTYGNPCVLTLSILAFIITILGSAFVAGVTSAAAGGITAVMFLAFFTYVNWFPVNMFIVVLIVAAVVLGYGKGLVR